MKSATLAPNQQTTLGLSLPEEMTFERFIIGENALVVKQCQALFDSAVDKAIYLWGSVSCGKSHLLKAMCYKAQCLGLTQAMISLVSFDILSPDILQGLENCDLVCIDDVDAVAGNNQWEEALFHFYNRLLTTTSKLLVSAKLPANQTPWQLPDLRSRLNASAMQHLKTLSDADKVQAIIRLAESRGMRAQPQVAEFILNHCSRDMRTIVDVVRACEQLSLTLSRPLTVPLVKLALEQRESDV